MSERRLGELPPHPWLVDAWAPAADPIVDQSRTAITRAVEVLGYDYVNGRAWEWTQFARVDDRLAMAEFAGHVEGEAYARIEDERLRRERERLEEIARIDRRNAAAAIVLLLDAT